MHNEHQGCGDQEPKVTNSEEGSTGAYVWAQYNTGYDRRLHDISTGTAISNYEINKVGREREWENLTRYREFDIEMTSGNVGVGLGARLAYGDSNGGGAEFQEMWLAELLVFKRKLTESSA